MLADEYEPINVKEALHYRKIYDSINESMYGVKKVQELQKTLAEEQYRQQQIQKEQLEKENQRKQYGFITGLAIMFSIAFILYRNNLQKRKANNLLQFQKEKIESTLAELKTTQAQLIQSEKLASLGELTAGIAHEIQNPLNFVNNFSEVSHELIDEMKEEIKQGNFKEVNLIADDVKQNLAKINHHGQRASSIVKGMLEHSRTSSGEKTLTDINALCEEYLRLAYQSMRSKDKSFQCETRLHLDPSLPNINVVGPDISRVILNLLNNAFQACNEKSGSLKIERNGNYTPFVTITTKNHSNKIEIIIKDNGNGIPDSIKEKIFQPFFTTKPTGQGTGLGLSLAYDIVKAHGGEITIESQPGNTIFKIILPVTI